MACAMKSVAPAALTRLIEFDITHPNHERASMSSTGLPATHGTPLSKEPAVGFTHS
jgi:hypothetical protein